MATVDGARSVARALAIAAIVMLVSLVLQPWFKDVTTFGFHDWDVQTSHRELVRQSLLRYHEFPGWNPFACGGFPAWGYVEADTIVVSPFLPLYLALPMALALRLEVLGMAALGAAGAYFAASRFSKSEAARALVVIVFAVNGRWALQTAAGHTWHLAYALLPWCLFFFERARDRERRVRDLALGGAAIAMLVYTGGIYPLPHTVLALGLYACGVAVAERSPRPLTTLAAMGLIGVGLAAPKLLPLLVGFGKAPRLIASTETLDVGAFVTMLTSRDQAFGARPARVTPYGWHEWGLYIGAGASLILLVGLVFVRGRREMALKVAALAFLALGFGAFHPYAPWTLLHAYIPVFRSQHVPSRFLYTAVLLAGLVAAAGIGRLVERRAWLDAVLAGVALLLAYDVGTVAQKPMAAAMWMVPPDRLPNRPFHFEQEAPFAYKRRDWAGPMYLAMLGNTGVINCYGAPPFEPKGAVAVSSPAYNGEAWLDGPGSARVVAWSPNHAEIELSGASEGELLVYNMNHDEGWSSDAGPVVSRAGALAVRVPAGRARVTFKYTPPLLGLGVVLFLATAGICAALHRREAA